MRSSRRPPVVLLLVGLHLLVALSAVAAAAPGGSSAEASSPSFAEITAGLDQRSGLLDLWVDEPRGRVYLALPRAAGEEESGDSDRRVLGRYLWVEGLVSGLGSNPVGLDRGQLGETRVAAFRRLGGKVVLEVENPRFRALSEDPLERRAVAESFAPSVVWAAQILAEEDAGGAAAGGDGGRLLVDFTSFLLSDAHRVVRRLKQQEQGAWRLDPERSAVDPAACLVFPDNAELEAVLTYAAEEPGSEVRGSAAVGDVVTLVQHHSFIRLPDAGFRPRELDPRGGFYSVAFKDYAAPLDAPLEKRYIARHRLGAEDVEGGIRPIVFYVDRAAPEPIRGALVEGVSWWAEAFAAAGFPGGFRVELLPPDAHPLDVRYNVVEWVHRSTRGWSFGGGVIDPRTGEIVKGHVNLGSLRVRQDQRIFEGLLGVEKTGRGGPDDPIELALARLRQLAAHEVGHALGLDHNFAASTYGRASVMDYPAPLLRVGEDGELDVSAAYGVGVGEWDIQAIRWGYSRFPPEADPAVERNAILQEGLERGLFFLSDDDARPPGAAHPRAALWDNGGEPVAELRSLMAVRRLALSRFGGRNLAEGRPRSRLQEVLVPIYLLHRYQVEAVAKAVGGLDYRHAVNGDGQPPARPVAGEEQRRALAALLAALAPEELDLPDEVLALLSPPAPGSGETREIFTAATAPVFDPLGAAAVAADLVVAALLNPERAARLVDFARRDESLPSFAEVLEGLVETTFGAPEDGARRVPRRAELRRTVQALMVRRLVELAGDARATAAVRARVEAALEGLERRLAAPAAAAEPAQAAHQRHLEREIRRFLDRPVGPAVPPAAAPPAPPGSPIGGAASGDSPGFWTGCSRGGGDGGPRGGLG